MYIYSAGGFGDPQPVPAQPSLPSGKPPVTPDEIIVTRADGTRFHVRRKVRVQVLTRPGRPRAGFCRDDERVFFRLSWCEGTQGTIDAGANPQGAFKDLMDKVLDQINRRQGLDQIKQTIENASARAFLDLDIAKVGSWEIRGDLKLDINRTGIASTAAKLSADRGWVKVGVEYKDDAGGKQVLVTADLSQRKIAGKKCPVRELAIWWDAECLREVPTTDTLKSGFSIDKHECLFLYFDYAKDSLRRDPNVGGGAPTDDVTEILRSDPKVGTARLNKRALERLDYLVGQGYWLTSVDGYTSPEGRRRPPGPSDRGPAKKWEGNELLSDARAKKVRELIVKRYGPGVRTLSMREFRRMRFPPGVQMPVGTGRSEHPRLDDRVGGELEGSALDRILMMGGWVWVSDEAGRRSPLKMKPFLEEHPRELTGMTVEDRNFVTDKSNSVHERAQRLYENLRRVEIHLKHSEPARGPVVKGFRLEHEHNCPNDVIEAVERKWGSRIPFFKPDLPLCN